MDFFTETVRYHHHGFIRWERQSINTTYEETYQDDLSYFFCCETKNFMIPWTLCGGTMQKISQFFAQYLFTHLPCTILAQLSKK